MKQRLLPTIGLLLLLQVLALAAPSITQAQDVAPTSLEVSDRWSAPIVLGRSIEFPQSGPRLFCDDQQVLHIFWHDRSISQGSAIHYVNNRGGSLSRPTDILLTENIEVRSLRALIDKDVAHLFWIRDDDRTLRHAMAPAGQMTDAGAWSEPKLIADDVGGANVALHADGTVVVAYGTRSTDETDLVLESFVITLPPGTDTWSDPQSLYSLGTPRPSYMVPEIAIDAQGNLHLGIWARAYLYGTYSEAVYVKTDRNGENPEVYFEYVPPAPRPGMSFFVPYIFEDDLIHLTWHGPTRFHQTSSDGGETWTTEETIMPLGAAFGGPNKLAEAADGTVYAVTGHVDGIYTASKNERGWGQIERVDNRDFDPHAQDMIICGGNELHVVYDDNEVYDVYHSVRILDTPPIAQEALSQPVALPTPTPQLPNIDSSGVVSAPVETEPTPDPVAPIGPVTRDFGEAEQVTLSTQNQQFLILGTAAAIPLLLVVTVLLFGRRPKR